MENPARNVCFWRFQQKGSFVTKIKNAGREGQYSKLKCQCIQKTVPLGRENMHFYPFISGREGGHAKTPVLSPKKAPACIKRLREWAVSESIARVYRVSFPSLKSLGKRLDDDNVLFNISKQHNRLPPSHFSQIGEGPKNKLEHACGSNGERNRPDQKVTLITGGIVRSREYFFGMKLLFSNWLVRDMLVQEGGV